MKGVRISSTSKLPMYQQLYEQISSQIIKGDLEKDFSLPSIRTAAKELRVSIITVKTAWEKLEIAGLIYTISGKGSFVADLTNADLNQKLYERFEERLLKDLKYYKTFDISEEEIIAFIKKNYNK